MQVKAKQKNMCFRLPTVPKFRSPTLIFLLLFLAFYSRFFSQKNVFNFKFIFVAAYMKNNFTKSVFVRPDFLYSLVYGNFFQRSNVAGRNKNKNKMSQNKDIT